MADSSRIEELKRRVQLDPASIAFAALAEEYRRAGQFEDAITTCQAGLQRHPAYLSARVTLGRSLLEIGDYDQAREELELVLRSAPENLAAIRGLAEIHHRRGELPEVLEQYRSGLAATPPEEEAAPPAVPEVPAAQEPISVRPVQLSSTESEPESGAESAPPISESPSIHEAPAFETPPAIERATTSEAGWTGVTAFPSETARPVAPVAAAARATAPPSVPELTTPSRIPHPDELALPALESFLAAILRVKESRPPAVPARR
jgi:tetratricopeptide (TPR) repeat protein